MVRIRTLSADTQLHEGAMIPLIVIIGGDITTAKEHRIYYEKRSGTTGYWTATIQDATNGYIKYDTTATDLDENGIWKFWGWEKDASDNINVGKAIKVMVHEIGAIPPN